VQQIRPHPQQGSPFHKTQAVIGLASFVAAPEFGGGKRVLLLERRQIDVERGQLAARLLGFMRQQLVQGAIHQEAGLSLLIQVRQGDKALGCGLVGGVRLRFRVGTFP
jgi:hypothetical protein